MNMTIVLACLELSSLIYNGTQTISKFSLIKSFEENSLHPKFLVAKDHEDMYIIIRGEASIYDFEQMMDFMPIHLKSNSKINNLPSNLTDSFVTSGVFKSAQNIIEKIQLEIKNCSGKIIFTGHSFGGSVAAMAATLIRLNIINQIQFEENKNNNALKDNYNKRTFAITFGSYPCVSPDLAHFTRRFITGFVVNHDTFPSMNPKNIANILDSIVHRGTPQAKNGAAQLTTLFAHIYQHFQNESKNAKGIDIRRKSLEMTLKLIKTAPKASNIKMINCGIVYHVFDYFDSNTKKQNKKESNVIKNLFKIPESSNGMDNVEDTKNAEITQFNEDVKYGNILELLSGISDHYIDSYCNVIIHSQNLKYPYYL